MIDLSASTSTEFKKHLSSALALDLPYFNESEREWINKAFPNLKLAAVLMLFGFSSDSSSLLYTKRTEHVETHKGQMAFPGGYSDPDDAGNPIVTALRETEEEVGISRQMIEVVGQLPDFPTSSGFLIRPVVGVLHPPLETVRLVTSPQEIDQILWAPLKTLLSPQTYRQEFYEIREGRYPIHVYQINEYRIWGATGAMTKNLLDRLTKLR